MGQECCSDLGLRTWWEPVTEQDTLMEPARLQLVHPWATATRVVPLRATEYWSVRLSRSVARWA